MHPVPKKVAELSLLRSLPTSLARALASDGLPRLATLVGTALVAAQLALLTWKFVPTTAIPPNPAATVLLETPRTDQASRLFGEPPSAAATTIAPPTNIALTLVGTLAVNDPTAGLAILGPTVNDAHVYATGSDVAPGIRLLEVYTDRVIIDRGGVHETLNLPHSVGGMPPVTQGPALADVARQAAAAPEVIGDLIRPMPNYVAGQLRGFRLFPGRARKKFDDLGLQPGDVVTQVNGVPLQDAQHGLELLQTLGSATSATVTIERGGTIQSVTIDSSQLATLSGPNGAHPLNGPNGPAPIESNPNNE